MQSDEHAREVERSKKERNRDTDSDTGRVKLKIQVYGLRHERRQMTHIERKYDEDSIPENMRKRFAKYKSRALDAELDGLTMQHAYGQMRTVQTGLRAPRFQF